MFSSVTSRYAKGFKYGFLFGKHDLLFILGHMIVSAQMKTAVCSQKCHFSLNAVAVLFRLGENTIGIKNDISEDQFTALGIDTVGFSVIGYVKIGWLIKIKSGKRKNIGGRIYSPRS